MSTYNSDNSCNTLSWTHRDIYDHHEMDWSSEEDLFKSIRRVEELTLLMESSATKIQKIWLGFKTRKEISQGQDISLERARLRKYQKANVIRARRCFPSALFNAMPFWSDESTVDLPTQVSFNEDCSNKIIGKKGVKSSQTDFRVREQKPMNIAVKIINCAMKCTTFSQFLVKVPKQDLLEIDAIFTEAAESLKEKGRFRFSDPHSSSITSDRSGILAQTHMILRIHANIPTPISCIAKPIMTTVTEAPKLARTGPTYIAGVPRLARTGPTYYTARRSSLGAINTDIDDIETRLNRILSNRY